LNDQRAAALVPARHFLGRHAMLIDEKNSAIPPRQRWLGLACDAGVALTFACVLIGAGHGVGPIGLLMVVGSPEAWGLPMAAGWTGLAALALAALVAARSMYTALTLAGLGMVFLSWCLFVAQSASVFASVVYFSIPFLGALAGRLVYLAAQLRPGVHQSSQTRR